MKRMLLWCVFVLVARVASAQTPPVPGSVGCIWEAWNNVASGAITDPQQLADNPWLLGNPNPNLVQNTVNFAALLNVSGIYVPLVARMRCQYTAPETGQYKFWMASNGKGKLYYSTADQNFAGKSPIAQMTNAVAPSVNQWLRYCEQSSKPVTICNGITPQQINFTAGQTVYFELVYMDTVAEAGTNLNHASAKIQLPDGTQQGPMLGSTLSVPPALPPSFTLTNNGISTNGSPAATSTISANLQFGTTQPVTFSVQSGLPVGMTSAFANPVCSPTCASVLTLTTGITTPAGTYTIVVAATVQWVVQTTSFQITVVPPIPPTPTITANPTAIRLGESTTVMENPGNNSTTCTLSASPANANWSGPALVSAITTASIAPRVTTTFSVTCTNLAGTTPADVTVQVTPPTLAWDPVTKKTDGSDAIVLGYNVYWGTTPDTLAKGATVTGTQLPLIGFTANVTYYFAVTAFDATSESAFSAELPSII